MQIDDVAGVLGLVARAVRNFEKDGKPASAVTLTRLYDTSVDDLWDALTSSERLPRWFLPVEGDLRLGGRYQLRGNAGGTITACTPPTHFAATWEFGGGTSWIDVKLAAERGKARLTLEHTALIEDHWNQFGPGAVGIGWDLALIGLGRYLATGASVDHATAEAWMGSPNGKAFMRASGEAWRMAHVASGVEPASAKERSDRTIAFYLGETPTDVAHPGTGT
ncbi:MAG: SRPBCC family protein [Rhodospirillales bacterium]|nr:SRPBCC family protein [Rhodospirillales bacterium]